MKPKSIKAWAVFFRDDLLVPTVASKRRHAIYKHVGLGNISEWNLKRKSGLFSCRRIEIREVGKK